VSDELDVPRLPQWRISDAERQRVVERLRVAMTEGRITPEEFVDRSAAAMAAVSYADVEPILADLPGGPVAVQPRPYGELTTTFQTLRRRGQWVVPQRLKAVGVVGNVKLNFSEAVIMHPVVEIDLDVYVGTTVLVLPPGASADIDGVTLVASPGKLVGVPSIPGAGVHFVVRGRQVVGKLIVRYERRLGRRRW
jgi:hypothetical protein